ncbi:YGGT family protein, putative, partial [Hepatocystis sp. ex Piliocolobus tephrosceles]
RIYKFIIYIRCLLEWLPQINPHLVPFVYVFTYTNSYVQFFHKNIPSVYGIDLSGVFSWLFLEMLENVLS